MHERWLCVCVCVLALDCRRRCRHRAEYFWFLNADVVADTMNIAINCRTQRWHNPNERTACRPCAVFSCCFGFYFFRIFVFPILSRAHSFVCSAHSFWRRWMENVKYEQQTAPTTSQLKWRNQIYEKEPHAPPLSQDGTVVKVKSYELRKEWFVHKLGRRLNGIFSCWVIKTKQTAKKCWYHDNNDPTIAPQPHRFFPFSFFICVTFSN